MTSASWTSALLGSFERSDDMRAFHRLSSALLGTIVAVSCAAAAATPGPMSERAALGFGRAEALAPHVLDSRGHVNAAAYRRLAASLAAPSGVRYRFGSASKVTSGTEPHIWKRPSKNFLGHGQSADRTYQVGGPQKPSVNDFSSDQGQVGYSPDSSSDLGVDQIETLGMSENTFSQRPQLSWTFYGGGHPAPDLTRGGATGRCMARLGTRPGRFVAQARAYAHGEATANSLIAFDNGVIAAAGTNTAAGEACVQLPAGLRPSAISVTNGNEFAVVTAWNTRTLRSELAVIALGGKRSKGDFWDFEWQRLYPGLRNYGRPTFAKYLGSLPLPMAAATSLSAVSDNSLSAPLVQPKGGGAELGKLTLTNEDNRRLFIDGFNKDAVARAGYAVVASREEKKIAFVDLQRLFEQITGAYFRTRAEFKSVTRRIGSGAREWPVTFSVSSAARPVVVKTATTASAPTAVCALLSGATTSRSYVATVDGRLHVFAVGGLASAARVEPAAIREVGTIRIGRNTTGITYVKDRATGHALDQSLDNTLILTSREERSVRWLRLDRTGATGRTVRLLRDARIVDPISAEDNNTHGTESYVITVADFGGRAVLNYRYGPVIFHTNGGAHYGMGPRGNAKFEFGGAYRLKGRPYSISITNVT